ncbi:VPLPA-CTERM-specific exosortase XrtD [Thiocapsa imhoffii]|uniref:VPLPA-CTERM-specific exosortase XrtD n=2 Tax=Thiocapsa imhoffii TaxID=382777 RepID=A0A9X0WIU0_9GAMM|nr:VPLPA-CTERM-specific exosortase XrtD [Thiocapsa imhoffii]
MDDLEDFRWISGRVVWILVSVAAIALGFMYAPGATELLKIWGESAEYSYGYFIPIVSLLMVWQQKHTLSQMPFKASWIGLLVLAGGLFFYFVGTLSTIFLIVHYSFILVLFGLVLSMTGWPPMRFIWPALVYLAFMIPFPPFLYTQLSFALQLISSEIGVAVIRWFGISVFLEGNVIDLGDYKLQVVDACSGLRYLFPLMSFGFLMAYLFRGPLWQRIVLFLSTIPITVLMNSFRIGVIGVLVEYFGIAMAEGFLHDFEGWAIFMACTVILVIEAWIFWRFSKSRPPSFWDAFNLDLPESPPASQAVHTRTLPRSFLVAVALIVVAAFASEALSSRPIPEHQRTSFIVFPDRIGAWDGRPDTLEAAILEELDVDDYFIGDFLSQNRQRVNFYVAYYGSQQAGAAAHSPRSCIPGGGWKITDLRTQVLDEVLVRGEPLTVNRLKIQRGDDKQLVYYWFDQRGRLLTNEYAVKWYLFWDALTQNRTDGALIRLTTVVQPGEDWSDADARLTEFADLVNPQLTPFLPD